MAASHQATLEGLKVANDLIARYEGVLLRVLSKTVAISEYIDEPDATRDGHRFFETVAYILGDYASISLEVVKLNMQFY